MKNFIKIITIFGMLTFASLVHSVEDYQKRSMKNVPTFIMKSIYKGTYGTFINLINPTSNLVSMDIASSQTPISVYKLAEDYYKREKSLDENKINELILRLFKNEFNREKTLFCALTDGARDKLKIDVPEDIIHLLLSYLPGCNLDEKKEYSPKLLAQAQKEFDEQ